ncbi:MAG: class I SAM-dependent methyltransferase [Pseudomonadota bacterium]|jgi:predicted O-methyltransferase YrrM|uniref:class I SAM-dependent methyltransferase n=1 Tax=Methylophaga aminisulfidivorans TaxID=230105 RepID=UPI0024E1DBE1|nr:class I SAM-dependent methyltransferase [Methylophaga aminisulfidivorans]MEC9413349.1 class I SAM-dependent methyltransferase [Pseudomonadota bacterium]
MRHDWQLTVSASDQISDAVELIPGWTSQEQLMSLFNLTLATAHLDGDVIEVGSWCGRSAIAIGFAIKQLKNAHLHCVDLFPAKRDWYKNADGSYSFKVQVKEKLVEAYQDQTVWAEPFHQEVLPVYEIHEESEEIFRHNTRHCGLGNYISPHKGNLTTFLESVSPEFKVRMAFIDGDHSYESVCSDISLIETRLVSGGWLCFDDAFSSYDGVDKAIREKIIKSNQFDVYQQLTRKLFVARKR